MSEPKRQRIADEEYPPRAGNTALTPTLGPSTNPRTFTFSSPDRHYEAAARLVQRDMDLFEGSGFRGGVGWQVLVTWVGGKSEW
jgi:hypothetical protein